MRKTKGNDCEMAYRRKSAKSRTYRSGSPRGRKNYRRGKSGARKRTAQPRQQTVKIIVETAGNDPASMMKAMGYTGGTSPDKRKSRF